MFNILKCLKAFSKIRIQQQSIFNGCHHLQFVSQNLVEDPRIFSRVERKKIT